MSTLLLRLAAPLQSWGAESKFDIRRTGREPTKSGVVGLIAASLGRKRDEEITDLCSLRYGVRVDQEGELLTDFHMVKKDEKTSYLTHRYYLSDAVFLAGVESRDEQLLKKIDEALRNPAFPLFLGRRACPPTMPLSLGIRDTDLETSLSLEKWQASEWWQKKYGSDPAGVMLRIVIDAKEGEVSSVAKDLPVSYDPRCRRYDFRAISEKNIVKIPGNVSTCHDPMKELSGG